MSQDTPPTATEADTKPAVGNTTLAPNASMASIRRQSLQKIVWVDGPSEKFPESIMQDLLDHFSHDGVDDFSMKLWQTSYNTIKKYEGRPATFLDRRNNQEIEVTRFAYENYSQNIGKQIVIASLVEADDDLKTTYHIVFGPEWWTLGWGVWVPIHRRDRFWRLQSYSNVLRATAPKPPEPSQPRKPRNPKDKPFKPVPVAKKRSQRQPKSDSSFTETSDSETEEKGPRQTWPTTSRTRQADQQDERTDSSDSDVEDRESLRFSSRSESPSTASSADSGPGKRSLVHGRSSMPPSKRPRLRIIFHDSHAEAEAAAKDANYSTLPSRQATPRHEGPVFKTRSSSVNDDPAVNREHINIDTATQRSTPGRAPMPKSGFVDTLNRVVVILSDDDADDEANVRVSNGRRCSQIGPGDSGQGQGREQVPTPSQSPLHDAQDTSEITKSMPSATPVKSEAGTGELRPNMSNYFENVTALFKDRSDKTLDKIPFSECGSAMDLFDSACACEVADKETRILEVQVGDAKPVRVRKDNDEQFERKILRPLKSHMRKDHLEIVVKHYM